MRLSNLLFKYRKSTILVNSLNVIKTLPKNSIVIVDEDVCKKVSSTEVKTLMSK